MRKWPKVQELQLLGIQNRFWTVRAHPAKPRNKDESSVTSVNPGETLWCQLWHQMYGTFWAIRLPEVLRYPIVLISPTSVWRKITISENTLGMEVLDIQMTPTDAIIFLSAAWYNFMVERVFILSATQVPDKWKKKAEHRIEHNHSLKKLGIFNLQKRQAQY